MADPLDPVKSSSRTLPLALKWRSSTPFILTTVGIGILSDLFIYGVTVPILPYLLVDRAGIPESDVQWHVSASLAIYAAANIITSPVAGYIADKRDSRQLPFLVGLIALAAGVVLMLVAQSIAVMHVSRLLQGASSGFVWSVGIAMCIDTVGPENLGKTIGTIFSFLSVAELSAPVLGGVIYKHGGVLGIGGLLVGVLILDFVMRVLVIEKSTAAQYMLEEAAQAETDERGQDSAMPEAATNETPGEDANGAATEETSLLKQKKDLEAYYIPPDQPWIIRQLPILYTFRDSGLLSGFALTLMFSIIIGSYDSTIPTRATELWGFDSMQSGLLFMPIVGFNLVMGPLGGWITDKRGTKLPAVIGFFILIPALIMLRIPQREPQAKNVALWCVFLGMTGLGGSLAGSPSMVEVGAVVHKYEERNPGFFGKHGPYAQLYGLNSGVFSLGLTIGPILGGALKESIGYGNMNAVVAALSAFALVICFFYLGGPPSNLFKKKDQHIQ